MKEVPILQTERLTIRPFEMPDLEDIHRIHDSERLNDPEALNARREWLQWMAYLSKWYMGFYADRAVVLRATNELIGAVGFVAELEPFESLPYLGGKTNAPWIPEISLYWQIVEPYRRQGYASEAAQALVDYAFKVVRIKRLFALTDPDNLGSLGVMRKLGMYIERAQGACGILENKLL